MQKLVKIVGLLWIVSGFSGCTQPESDTSYADAVTIYEAEIQEMLRISTLPAAAEREQAERTEAEIQSLIKQGAERNDRLEKAYTEDAKLKVEGWWRAVADANFRIDEQKKVVRRAIEVRDKARERAHAP